MVLKSVGKLLKLQAQTLQFEMTVHADEMQIYPIMYKPKHNPKTY